MTASSFLAATMMERSQNAPFRPSFSRNRPTMNRKIVPQYTAVSESKIAENTVWGLGIGKCRSQNVCFTDL